VTRERLYIEGVESVLSKSRKVIVDSKSGNQMLYLPLDKLLERGARGRATVTAPRPATVTRILRHHRRARAQGER
jgi:modulator of FtsH protease HflK